MSNVGSYDLIRYNRCMSTKRSCGTCTKCCEGHLFGEINGRVMSPGNPCYLIQIGKGCMDYENRPKEPCQTFECEWLQDETIPDELKPETSGVILTYQKIDGIKFLRLTKAPNEPNADDLSWFFSYVLKHRLNAAWDTNTKVKWMGSPEFSKAMQKELQ